MIDLTIKNINRLFVLSLKSDDTDAARGFFGKCYMS